MRAPLPSDRSRRLPAVYLPHGGGPWPFVDVGFGERSELDALAAYLRSVATIPAEPPAALLVVSAHWEERLPTVTTAEWPALFFDYYGFPPEAYRLTWPAPGSPPLAARVRALLSDAGIESAEDGRRGYDHGTFVPLTLAYPRADVPVVQLSLVRGLDPRRHLEIGRALRRLREEGIFVIGSGMSFHDLRGFGPRGRAASEAFDAWLGETVTLDEATRAGRLESWSDAPSARAAHPREEHLLPLMAAAGAAGDDPGRVDYNGLLMGVRISAVRFG